MEQASSGQWACTVTIGSQHSARRGRRLGEQGRRILYRFCTGTLLGVRALAELGCDAALQATPDVPKTRSSANRRQSHGADGSHLERIMAPCQQLMNSAASRSGSSSALI